MDPVSLILAIPPIATTLLTACFQGYGILCRMSAVGKDAQGLLCSLQIEHARLWLWANNLHADGTDFDEQLDRCGIKNLVVLILANLCTIFTDTERLRKSYGLLVPQGNWPDPGSSNPTLPSFLTLFGAWSGTVASHTESIKIYTKHIQQSLSVLDRLKFALKDKKKFTEMLDQLRYFNDSLESLMVSSQRARMDLIVSSCIPMSCAQGRLVNETCMEHQTTYPFPQVFQNQFNLLTIPRHPTRQCVYFIDAQYKRYELHLSACEKVEVG
jgi:hypothetical protein